jgi:hypothetical protein
MIPELEKVKLIQPRLKAEIKNPKINDTLIIL